MADPSRILIVEDDPAIRRFVRLSLEHAAFEVLEAQTGLEGVQKAAEMRPDIILLDLGLPDMDGKEVAKRIRDWSSVPILVLSVRGEEAEKVTALDAGADDYLTKPFGIKELLARIRVALRHAQGSDHLNPIVDAGTFQIDLVSRKVHRGGLQVHLTPLEYGVLAALGRARGKVVTHKQLLREVWGEAYLNEDHYLRIYMGQLRQKLEDNPARPTVLITEPGVGYRLSID